MDLGELKGIGPSVLKKLEKLGIYSVEDLLFHIPFRYIDRTKALKVFDLKFIDDDNYHCTGKIKNIKKIRLPGRKEFTTATLSDDTGYITATWFNNPYIASLFKEDDEVIFSGKMIKSKLSNPQIRKVNSAEDVQAFAVIEGVYPETEGLKSLQLRKLISEGIRRAAKENFLKEGLPQSILKKERLIPKLVSLQILHWPENFHQLDRARERLGFEEIYKILKQVSKRKKQIEGAPAFPIVINLTSHEVLLNKLTFTLTPSQNSAIREIFEDIAGKIPMHRLLNGDVGSGKTIVAAAAAWQVVNNGLPAVFLAPTGVLAVQHYNFLSNLLQESKVKVHLVTSSTRKNHNKLLQELVQKNDEARVFVGTHALLHRLELFSKIGLLVIDEQHKFGVKQREILATLQSNRNEPADIPHTLLKVPHVLSMSATPIPRSLALTLFGDIEVSFLEKPLERKKIITKVIDSEDLEHRMHEWIRSEIKEKKTQVYVVCPLIEESAVIDAKSVLQEFERLKKIYPEFSLELLHGKLKPEEKDKVLERFKTGDVDILVSTSVIEVGIDNPNATTMIIEGAERFGLAQLHQIRGRVGRSEKQSYCFIKSTNFGFSKRLEFFSKTDDGLEVAEYDLRQRGPGEVYGEAQSGIPDLKVANILDVVLIRRVKKYIK